MKRFLHLSIHHIMLNNRFVLKNIFYFLLLNLLFLFSLSAVQLFDKQQIREGLLLSMERGLISTKHIYLSPYGFIVDNFSEHLALGMNLVDTNENIVKTALFARTSHTFAQALLNPGDLKGTFLYWRYWHGYQLYLKPLLSITTIETIRLLSHFITLVLIFLLYKFAKDKPPIRYVIVGLFVPMPFFIIVFHISTVHSVVFMTILASLVFLMWYIKNTKLYIKNLIALFFFSGVITNFFDFLWAPQILPALLGYLLLLHLYVDNYFQESKIYVLKALVFCVFFWYLGYILTFAMKWGLTMFVLPPTEISSDLFQQIIHRISGHYSDAHIKSIPDIPILSVTYAHFHVLLNNNVKRSIFLGIFIAACILFVQSWRQIQDKNKYIIELFILSTPICVLIFWLELVKNHSMVHVGHITYRSAYFIFMIPIVNIVFLNVFRNNKLIWRK